MQAWMIVFVLCGDPLYVVGQNMEVTISAPVEAIDVVPELGDAFSKIIASGPSFNEVKWEELTGHVCV